MDSISISILQTDLVWGDVKANFDQIESQIIKEKPDCDLLILPEMFTTGFITDPTLTDYNYDTESTIASMLRWAAQFNTHVAGSVLHKEEDKYYNRLLWVSPNGEIDFYDKHHLFSFAGEHKKITAGADRKIFELKGWRFCPMICYDLRFPVWSRNYIRENGTPDYDVLFYVANWPEVRSKVWINLLEARAHENQSYVCGCNRIGIDGNGINYSGNSSIYSFKGEELIQLNEGEPGWLHQVLSKQSLIDFREKFPALNDADQNRSKR